MVAVFGSSAARRDSREWSDAEAVGARLAGAGFRVVTGGYGGVMEAVSKGAAHAGGSVIGVTAPGLFPARSGANSFVTDERRAETLTGRIGTLIELASGVIVLPGSIGTAAELVVAWNLNHVRRSNGGIRLPTVAVGPVWREMWELFSARLGAFAEDVHLASTAGEAVDWLLEQPEML